jgi:hypothetical protein
MECSCTMPSSRYKNRTIIPFRWAHIDSKGNKNFNKNSTKITRTPGAEGVSRKDHYLLILYF